jgi:hypothetical protein
MNIQYKFAGLFLLISAVGAAQTKYAIEDGRLVLAGYSAKDKMQVSVGGGFNQPSATAQSKLNALKNTVLLGNMYFPLNVGKRRQSVSAGATTSFGINLGIQYQSGFGNYSTEGYTGYPIQGQSASPTVAAKAAGSPKSSGFVFEGGPQLNLHIKKLMISPIMNAGYINLAQKAMSVVQTSTFRDTTGTKTNTYNLYNQAATKVKGLVLTPKLRLSYFGGQLGFWAEGSYTMGPSVKTNATVFRPQGIANPATGLYTIDQMALGSNIAVPRETVKYRYMGLSLGISWAITPCRNRKGNNTGKCCCKN